MNFGADVMPNGAYVESHDFLSLMYAINANTEELRTANLIALANVTTTRAVKVTAELAARERLGLP